MVNVNAAKYWDQKPLKLSLWILNPKFPIKERVPFVANTSVAKIVTLNRLPLLIVSISFIVLSTASKLVGGKTSFKRKNTWSWNPSMGINGIKVNKKIIPGNNAKR